MDFSALSRGLRLAGQLFHMKRIAAAMLLATTLAGSAKRAEQIDAATISEAPFLAMSCPQLISERQAADAGMQQVALNQNSAAQTDGYGVLWLGLPVASMSGRDAEPTVAYAKGKVLAIDRAMVAKKCVVPGSSDDLEQSPPHSGAEPRPRQRNARSE